MINTLHWLNIKKFIFLNLETYFVKKFGQVQPGHKYIR